jgi:peptide/nickel transport system permease protein
LGLKAYLVKRLAYTVVLVFFVLTLNFIIFEALPGGNSVINNLIGSGHRVSPAQIQALENLYGLNKPIYVRYFTYLYNMVTLKFGWSIISGQPVLTELEQRLPNTLELVGTSTLLAIILGIALGMVSAYKRGGIADSSSVIASLTTFSLPTFWMGLLFIAVFADFLRWFPAGGNQPVEWSILGFPSNPLTVILTKIQYAFLPVMVLTIFTYGFYVLLTRATMIEALQEDYITTARAKGVSERSVIIKHAFKNASLPIVTSVALAFGSVLGGAIITETVFRWPGLGLWTFEAIQQNDTPILQTVFYLGALAIIFANFVADILYGFIDPRIKYG